MKKLLSSLLILCALTLTTTLPAHADKATQVLDGKTFSGFVGEEGDRKGDPDHFEFANGQFHSTACDEYGYTGSHYSASQAKNGVDFESTTKNDSGDTINWKGEIKGDKINGTAVRKTASGKEFKMWFNGELKKVG